MKFVFLAPMQQNDDLEWLRPSVSGVLGTLPLSSIALVITATFLPARQAKKLLHMYRAFVATLSFMTADLHQCL